MAKFIFALDTPAIHKFVFATDSLKEIAGASGLLDDLNRKQTWEILQRLPCPPEKIYCNGGKGLFVVEADAGDNGKAPELDKVIADLQALYREQTAGGAPVVCSYVPWDEKTTFQDSVYQAHLALADNRTHDAATVASPHSPFMKECESCGQNPVDDNDECICRVCRAKAKACDEMQVQRIWKELFDYVRADRAMERTKWHQIRPKNFEEIGKRHGSHQIAVVYADGNSMGKLLRDLDSPEVTKVFSTVVDQAIHDACYQALCDHCYDPHKQKIFGNILLLGGDDMVAVVPAENAIEFSIAVAENFASQTRAKIAEECAGNAQVARFFSGDRAVVREKGLTLCLGVAFGKDRQPFHMLLEQAEELLKLAKQKAKTAKQEASAKKEASTYYTPAYIDFHDATQSVFSNVKHARQHYVMKPRKDQAPWILTMRPYSLADLKKLQDHAWELKKSGWPNSKLQDIRAACFETPRELYHTLISLLGRAKSEEHDALFHALEEFHCTDLLAFFLPKQEPKKAKSKYDEPDVQELMLVDLLELASYLSAKEGA